MNRTAALCLALTLTFITSNPWGLASAQTTSPVSDVRDTAGLFGGDEVEAARSRLRALETELKVPTIVETIDSLKGKAIDEVAVALARRTGTSGIFVLIARRENKLEVLPSHRVEAALPRAKRNTIRGAFIEKFRKKEFDAGLKQGVEAIATALREAARDDKLPSAIGFALRSGHSGGESIPPLVPRRPESAEEIAKDFGVYRNIGRGPVPIVRNQVRLTLEGARLIIDAAEQQAESMKLKVNVSVVDDGGHPLAFARMDGARPASVYTAVTKAIAAATYRQPTGPIPAGTTQPDLLLNIGLQNAAAAGGGRFTTLLGGIPIVVDGQVIGGIGVGGGSGEQDAMIAKAGLDHFTRSIKPVPGPVEKPAEAPKSAASPAAASTPKPATPETKPADDRDF